MAGTDSVLGRKIEFDRRQFTVIGVMPAGFQFPIQTDPIDFYVTIAEDAANPDGNKPTYGGARQSQLGGSRATQSRRHDRAGAGRSLDDRGEFGKTVSRLEHLFRSRVEAVARGARRRRAHRALRFVRRGHLRVADRERQCRQSSARARFGPREKKWRCAPPWARAAARIIRQLLTESLLLAGLGGLFGLLIAQWGTEALIETVPQNIPRISNIQLDAAVLAFTLLVSLATGVIFRARSRLAGVACRSQHRAENRSAHRQAAANTSIVCATLSSWPKSRSRWFC